MDSAVIMLIVGWVFVLIWGTLSGIFSAENAPESLVHLVFHRIMGTV
jgi:hypothetical protein